ncbi:GNAT family N-acetyltransferase [Lactococcus sp.]|uniref:GNAT family N-acetyltransferase n=1 Tax=Lactococcus sp. TaxID=44273 RepID=UPI0035AF31D6
MVQFDVQLARFNFIESKNLMLRPFVSADSADLFGFSQNETALRFFYPPFQSQEACEYFMVENFMKAPLGTWAIELKEHQRLVGFIHFSKVYHQAKKAELGYLIDPAYQRRGLMGEALSVLIDFSFQEFGIDLLELVIDEENLASQALAEKFHFVREKQMKRKQAWTGQIRNFNQYQLKKAGYFARLNQGETHV